MGGIGGIQPTLCYYLAVTANGVVENQDAGYDEVSANGQPILCGESGHKGCEIIDKTETKEVFLCCGETNLTLRYDMIAGIFHTGWPPRFFAPAQIPAN